MGVNFSRSAPTTSTHCSSEGGGSSPRDEISDEMEKENEANGSEEEFFESQDDNPPKTHKQEMIEFKKDLAIKREQRRKIIAKHASEKENLRNSLEMQIKSNQIVSDENKVLRALLEQHNIGLPSTSAASNEVSELQGPIAVLFEDLERFKSQNRKLRLDLTETNVSLQSANSDIANMQGQNVEAMKQIGALKEVVAVTKTMMKIRESQLNELKAKLSEIEASLADREASLLSTDLRAEYERQLQNIRTLRALYEERARLAEVTRLQLLREVEEQKELAAVETSRCQELTQKVDELEAKITDMTDTIDNKDDQISVTKEETRGLKAEMSTVNKLFSQLLLGYKSQQDLDTLVLRLEEHHGLLSHLATRERGSDGASALPRLLLDLLGQLDVVEGNKGQGEAETPREKEDKPSATAEEIVDNLPKVWRVLMELLSHQAGPSEPANSAATPATCYKSVDTPTGSRMVPSVSQTYIRLKDLIVEKLSLTKEMSKMKQLNVHLETRLEEQERRLCLVTSELSKTWHVVGRLRRHHHQLHTHEKILRYELQQKRKLLNELKEELEFCREKWDKAKEKNTESEKEWKKLRNEFSSRKSKASIVNSGESGYSDERQTEDDSTESNDDSEYLNDPPLRCKKRMKKIEALPDSSTDANLAAEREDPISDMLDVAELPLDGLDYEESVDKSCESLKDNDELSASESCASEICAKSLYSVTSEKSVQSSRAPSASVFVKETSKKEPKLQDSSSIADITCVVDPDISASCSNTVSRGTNSAILSQNVNELSYRAEEAGTLLETDTRDSAAKCDTSESQSLSMIDDDNNDTTAASNIEESNPSFVASSVTTSVTVVPLNSLALTENENDVQEDVSSTDTPITPSEIFENIRKQNERLAQRDVRMQRLEEGCSSLLRTSINTLEFGADLENRLDVLHSESNSSRRSDSAIIDTPTDDELIHSTKEQVIDSNDCIDSSETTLQSDGESSTTNENKVEEMTNEPSTSSASIDHEARFAARDERLKRLEEQTKSLVDKVNDTTTKSVRITYKLEELHNIYGSEGSTPRNQSPEDDEAEDPKEENPGEQ